MNLITTNLAFMKEKFSPKDLLLGKWCLGNKSSENESKIISYHWDDRKKLYKDYLYLKELKKDILPLLKDYLNKIHNTNFSNRAWDIILGSWLIKFLTICFDRWQVLEDASKTNKKLNTIFYYKDFFEFIPKDTAHFLSIVDEDNWNHVFIGEIIKDQEKISFEFSPNFFINKFSNKKRNNFLSSFSKKLKKLSLLLLNFALNIILKKSPPYDYELFITDNIFNYFGLWKLITLKYKLKGNIKYKPILKKEIKTNTLIDFEKRNYKLNLIDKKNLAFERLIEKFILRWIPLCFLENFKLYDDLINIPRKKNIPFYLLSLYSYFDNDPLKFWISRQINNNAQLIIPQHGGHLNKFNTHQDYTHGISNIILTSGIQSFKSKKKIALGIFNKELKYKKWSKNGEALIVTVAMPRYTDEIRSMAISGQMIDYFSSIFKLYDGINKNIRNKTKIRLYHNDYNWRQKERWESRFPSVKISNKKISFKKIVESSRVVICTYNASVFLKTLAANVPTLIYWDENFWEIPKNYECDFKELKSAGIYHNSIDSFLKVLEDNWEDVGSWWYDPRLQEIRRGFCHKHYYLNKHFITDFSQIINNI